MKVGFEGLKLYRYVFVMYDKQRQVLVANSTPTASQS